jgi:glycosyltransferase involved in cell wall biosynthesis
LILQLSNYRYNEHPSEHALNMAFWRAIRDGIGDLHVVGRAHVDSAVTSRLEGITFTLFPLTIGTLSFVASLGKWLASQEGVRLVWNSDAAVTPIASESFVRTRKVPWLIELQANFFQTVNVPSPKEWLARRLAIRAARKAHYIRVCARSHVDELSRLHITGSRVKLIPTRVDVDVFNPRGYDERTARTNLGIARDSDVVIMGVGSLVRRKGFFHAIEALRHLPENVRLVLVGDGPERGPLSTLAEAAGVNRRVHFAGHRRYEEIPGLLCAADLIVLPSYNEGMPRVVNEAQAMEKPVVAFAVDGVVEQIVDGQTGFLCPPGQGELLTKAISTLVYNRELRRRMGVQARRHVVEHFGFDKVLKLWCTTLAACTNN